MVREGIILGHRITRHGIEADKEKVNVIEKLPPPTSVKGVRSFLGHADFYRRFIKDFSKIAKPLCKLLDKDATFKFNEKCLKAFKGLNSRLITAPIIVTPDWDLPFKLMCDASDFAIEAVMGQRRNKFFHPIYYASAKVTVYTDHSAIKYLLARKDVKSRLIRLELQEGNSPLIPIQETFPDEHILKVNHVHNTPWFTDIANFLAYGLMPIDKTYHQRKKFFHDVKYYFWEKPYLFKKCVDQMIMRCVAEDEVHKILYHCYLAPSGGHFGGTRTVAKVLQAGFFWPTLFKDAYAYVKSCDRCQRVRNVTNRNEMPRTNIIEVELFDVWGIDFLGLFPPSFGYKYILVAVDYVSKWVEVEAYPTNDAKVVMKFFQKHVFTRFGTPRAIISDEGSHFVNKWLKWLLDKHGVKHKVATAYHPHTNGQAELANNEIEGILEKVVYPNRRD
ncbi:hypothetical protein CXB51_000811 [Gossypium anomalum]|uniref:Integrase catalytic domain-containing protein n=1 Tax=Gossypium anomalum TaxID=47600 RepID=A0A8J5ZJM1_9ROSI|nr:hypothetical protein CXB51_000811 [Gossypium anomalum]